ncbi:MAG: HlyD family efflux transporter periplasmic adaptor subunit, partial [Merismopedia sp. SIO2A8]|nr:HlyD family efflux transporter periplasmic adaptor subunit [Merismopedia sp. SIO2A8]
MNDSSNLQPSNGQPRQNGNGHGTSAQLAPAQGGVALQAPGQGSAIEKKEQGGNEMAPQNVFDQPIILKQPAYWSRAILWTIMSVTTLSILVAWFGKVEEAIPATGQLEPEGKVQEVQAPAGGVVQDILVEDGDQVEQGQTLIRLDPEVSAAELESLVTIKQSTIVENDFYNAELYGQTITNPEILSQLEIPPYYSNLTLELKELKQREVVFNNYMAYLDQLAAAPVLPAFSGPLQELARAVWEQYSQVEQQIRGSQAQLIQLDQRIEIEQKRIEIAQQSQAIESDIVERIRPLVDDGALAEIQLERQQSEFLARQNEVGARYSELESLIQQQAALFADLGAARDQQEGVVASARADARGQLNNIVDRKQQITSDLNNRIITNTNRLAELEAQIEQAQTQLEYQEIRSPIDGVVFDVQPQVQGVVNPGAVEPVLKVVPDDALVATVFLPNQDVGFVLKALEEKGTSQDYKLELMSGEKVFDVPKEGNGTVFAVKLNRGYHIRIFDLAGNMLLDKTPRQFSPNDE